MAIAFGVGSGGNSSLTNTLSFTSVTVSGSDTYGVVGIMTNGGAPTGTWNGVSLVSIGSFSPAPESPSYNLYVLGVAGVTTGTIALSSSAATQIVAHHAFWNGVGSLDPAAAVTANSSSATSQAISITPTADNCWMVMFGAAQDIPGSGVSASTGATKRSTDADDKALFDGNGLIHPAASTSMTYTQASASKMAAIAFAIAPVGGGGGPTSTFHGRTLLGVGT